MSRQTQDTGEFCQEYPVPSPDQTNQNQQTTTPHQQIQNARTYQQTQLQDLINNNNIGETMRTTLATAVGPQLTIPNEPWGDEIAGKDLSLTRIYYQNINGIQPRDCFAGVTITAANAQSNQIDILALSETNVAWIDPTVPALVKQKLRQVWPQVLLAH